MSYEEYNAAVHDTLLEVIDYNAENRPKPHHHNRELMTTVLRMEVQHEQCRRPEQI